MHRSEFLSALSLFLLPSAKVVQNQNVVLLTKDNTSNFSVAINTFFATFKIPVFCESYPSDWDKSFLSIDVGKLCSENDFIKKIT